MRKTGLTKRNRDLLERIRTYETYDDEDAVQIWHEVRRRERHAFPRGFLHKYQHRVAIMKAFVDEYRKEHPGGYPNQNNFYQDRLSGLLSIAYGGSPYRAFVEAGFTNPKNAIYDNRLAETPWTVLEMMPVRYWGVKENRIAAVKHMVKTCGKTLNELIAEDFKDAGLRTVLKYTSGSPYEALKEAGYSFNPWEMAFAPNGYWKEKQNRVQAIQWLVEKLGKPVTKIVREDFEKSSLSGLIVKYSNVVEALQEAGYNVQPEDMSVFPYGYWKKPENRIKQTQQLVEQLGKPIAEIKAKDFNDAGLYGLLAEHDNSPHSALCEANFKIEPWQMHEVPHNYWGKKQHRVQAIKRLVESLGKKPEDFIAEDFYKNGVGAILVRYYKGSVCAALQDAGFDIDSIDMHHVPRNTWQNPANVRRAAGKISKETGKSLTEINRNDFARAGYSRVAELYSIEKLKEILTD